MRNFLRQPPERQDGQENTQRGKEYPAPKPLKHVDPERRGRYRNDLLHKKRMVIGTYQRLPWLALRGA